MTMFTARVMECFKVAYLVAKWIISFKHISLSYFIPWVSALCYYPPSV